MAMQTDVKSAHTLVDAVLYAGRVRLKGVFLTVAGGAPVASVKFYDNATAASGTIQVEIDTSHGTSQYLIIPGEGVLFTNGIYCDIGDADSVTVFYG